MNKMVVTSPDCDKCGTQLSVGGGVYCNKCEPWKNPITPAPLHVSKKKEIWPNIYADFTSRCLKVKTEVFNEKKMIKKIPVSIREAFDKFKKSEVVPLKQSTCCGDYLEIRNGIEHCPRCGRKEVVTKMRDAFEKMKKVWPGARFGNFVRRSLRIRRTKK